MVHRYNNMLLTLLKLDESAIKITWDDNSSREDGFYIDKKIGGIPI